MRQVFVYEDVEASAIVEACRDECRLNSQKLGKQLWSRVNAEECGLTAARMREMAGSYVNANEGSWASML